MQLCYSRWLCVAFMCLENLYIYIYIYIYISISVTKYGIWDRFFAYKSVPNSDLQISLYSQNTNVLYVYTQYPHTVSTCLSAHCMRAHKHLARGGGFESHLRQLIFFEKERWVVSCADILYMSFVMLAYLLFYSLY